LHLAERAEKRAAGAEARVDFTEVTAGLLKRLRK
jgi:hypothetical protein